MSAGSRPAVVHVAQVEVTPESGMGRVSWHWRRELERRGYEFIHIGPAQVGPAHPALFPWKAQRHCRRLGLRPAALLVHEPAGLPFLGYRNTVLFSHGLERRGWQASLELASRGEIRISPRSRILFPWWRLRPAELSLRRARAVLVLNRADLAFVQRHYGRSPEDVHLFRNGVDPVPPEEDRREDLPRILFIATWMARKGVRTLVAAAEILSRRGLDPRFVLAGTGTGPEQVLADWPEGLRASVRVIPRFAAAEESALHAGAEIFVLPSFFEGQPLALLQAMAAGRCCIASDIDAHRELIADRETGLLFPAGDAGRLADLLSECLADAELRRSLGCKARVAVASRTWDAVAAEVADVVERVARGDAGA